MCVFCTIASGDMPAHIVFDDDTTIAFLDHRPLFPGHTLVVPKGHVETLPELDPAAVGPYFTNVQALSRAVRDAMGAVGTFVAINNKVSQSVPHLHTHVVPRRPKDGLRGFFWPRTRYGGGDAEMAEVADRIRAELE